MHSAENGEGEINAKVPIWRVTAIVFVVAAVCLAGFSWSPTALLQGLFVAGGVTVVCFAVGIIWIEGAGIKRIDPARAAMKKLWSTILTMHS